MSRFFCCLILASLLGPAAQALPAQVLLIRHAEKPEQGPDLSTRGWERAKMLPSLFHARPEFGEFGPPVALYAMAPHNGHSLRAVETLRYVSADLKLPIQSQFLRGNFAPMVQEILNSPAYDGKFVVICWEHKVMTDIAQAFGVQPAPKYPGDRFDRAWLITFHAERSPSFEDLPEKLLPGDSSN